MQDVRDTVVDHETQSFFWDRYMALGKTAFQGGRLTEATRMFTMSLKTGMSIEDTSRRAYSLTWIAHVHYELGNLDDSDRLLRQVFQGNLDLDRDQEESEHLYELLALVQERQGRLNEAHETYGLLVDKAASRGLLDGKTKMGQYQSKQKELARVLFPDQFVEPLPAVPAKPVQQNVPDLFDSIESLSKPKPAVKPIDADKPAEIPPPAKEDKKEEKASFEVLAAPEKVSKETKIEQTKPVQEVHPDPPGVEDDVDDEEPIASREEEEKEEQEEEEGDDIVEEPEQDLSTPDDDYDAYDEEDESDAPEEEEEVDEAAYYDEEDDESAAAEYDDYDSNSDDDSEQPDDYYGDTEDDENASADDEVEAAPAKFALACRPKPAHIERRKIPVSQSGIALVTTVWDFSSIN